ncbi:hypothetical protein PEX1_081440 [Penicillium expansum]|uniref:DUF7600 domain-containing protein n=1 Tax=Penicillium expansum TaxID=27334 RepID=A0A0A2JHG6_PENEN|nr:hypothetical protein PEX2_039250 [Penicillium expansum]KGO38694.1 hypothetical protein PEXP_109720 [Penicillium expansum]KGO50105.1 hypothetical protein PEX1_081440 [Penicillium expansum]KGO54221.1 hypothetical protein PEX2_039250 [Penicillium expansum]
MDRDPSDSESSNYTETSYNPEYYNHPDSSIYCISCEWAISTEYPWMKRYRAYTTLIVHLTPGGTQLSDVCIAEYDWHEEEYNTSPKNRNIETFGPWYFMADSKPAKAFMIHECCWLLLIKHFANEEVNLDRLFEVCRNIPASAKAIPYSKLLIPTGILIFNKTYLIAPGKENLIEINEGPWYPLQRPVIKGIGDASKELSKTKGFKKGFSNKTTFRTDCFGLLAMEIRLEIAGYLSTVDFLSLRFASRTMAVLFELQSFWKTRFRVNGDRGFLACLADTPQNRKSKSWRSIYRCTAKIEQQYLYLWALRRQWRNNRWLADRYSMVKGLDDQPGLQNCLLLGEVPWNGVSVEIRCDRNCRQGNDWSKCKNCWEEHVPVLQAVALENVTSLAVSILPEGTKTYITGFDLISADFGTPNTTLGYRLPGSQVTVDLRGQQLQGFTVIAGEGGIYAIRPIFKTNIIGSWIGQPDGVCNSTQLVLEGGIKAISGKFDVSHFRH